MPLDTSSLVVSVSIARGKVDFVLKHMKTWRKKKHTELVTLRLAARLAMFHSRPPVWAIRDHSTSAVRRRLTACLFVTQYRLPLLSLLTPRMTKHDDLTAVPQISNRESCPLVSINLINSYVPVFRYLSYTKQPVLLLTQMNSIKFATAEEKCPLNSSRPPSFETPVRPSPILCGDGKIQTVSKKSLYRSIIAYGNGCCIPGFSFRLFLRSPPLNSSIERRDVLAIQATHAKAPKTASARAALHTEPLQNSSFERNTERAINPAKWKSEFRISRAKCPYW